MNHIQNDSIPAGTKFTITETFHPWRNTVNRTQFNALASKTAPELLALGLRKALAFRRLNKTLWFLPASMLDSIPLGATLYNVFGESISYVSKSSRLECFQGMLQWGIMRQTEAQES